MNAAALLALIADLYAQVATLSDENIELRKRLLEGQESTAPASP